MEKRYIKAIQISRRVTDTIFNLPCIYSVHKEADDTPCYLLFDWDEQGNYKQARPTDWLCLDQQGRWNVLTEQEYESEFGDGYAFMEKTL